MTEKYKYGKTIGTCEKCEFGCESIILVKSGDGTCGGRCQYCGEWSRDVEPVAVVDNRPLSEKGCAK